MSKTVLSNVDGFTPLIDSLTQEHGVVTAAVFGRMWRYCQGDRGVCQATLERIGDDLGLDKATVQRHAAKLCELGYLEDTTPGLRNRPHTYRDTGKAAMAINIHVADSNVTLHSATSDCTPQRDVAESRLKKEVKRQVKKGEQPAEKLPAPPRPDYYPLATALAEVCHMKLEANRGLLFREAETLSKVEPTPTPDLLKQHYSGQSSFWHKSDWRGKKGEWPSPAAIRKTWGQWADAPAIPTSKFIEYS